VQEQEGRKNRTIQVVGVAFGVGDFSEICRVDVNERSSSIVPKDGHPILEGMALLVLLVLWRRKHFR